MSSSNECYQTHWVWPGFTHQNRPGQHGYKSNSQFTSWLASTLRSYSDPQVLDDFLSLSRQPINKFAGPHCKTQNSGFVLAELFLCSSIAELLILLSRQFFHSPKSGNITSNSLMLFQTISPFSFFRHEHDSYESCMSEWKLWVSYQHIFLHWYMLYILSYKCIIRTIIQAGNWPHSQAPCLTFPIYYNGCRALTI